MLNATMKSAVAKKELELALAGRFGAVFQRREKQPAEIVPTGIGEIDARVPLVTSHFCDRFGSGTCSRGHTDTRLLSAIDASPA